MWPLAEIITLGTCYLLYLAIASLINVTLPTNIAAYDYWWWIYFVVCVVIYYCIKLPPMPWFNQLGIWKWFRQVWFPLTLHGYGGQSPPSMLVKNAPIYVYAAVPHGIWSVATTFSFLLDRESFGHVRCICASQLFWLPFIRNLAQISGAGPATADCISETLNNGQSMLLVVEGMSAFTYLDDREAGVMTVLGRHKGFCRLITSSVNANRIHVIPVFTPGEWDVYRGVFFWKRLQRWMISHLWYAGPFLTFGWWGTPLPKRVPLDMYFGDPIPCVDDKNNVKLSDVLHADVCAAFEKMMSKQ